MRRCVAGLAVTLISSVGLLAQKPETATVLQSAPIFIAPDATRSALRVMSQGAAVRVIQAEGEWFQVEFQDPQWGRRVGYIEAKLVRRGSPASSSVANVAPSAATPGVDNAVPEAVATTSAPALTTGGSRATDTPHSAPVSRDGKVSLFVKGSASEGGFTDPSKDRQDSVKDLLKKLRDSKWITLVNAPGDAVAVLEVLNRETKRETNLWGGQNKSYLTVKLSVGEYSAEFSGESGSKGILKGYGAAAGKVANQLEEWVKANRDKLLSR